MERHAVAAVGDGNAIGGDAAAVIFIERRLIGPRDLQMRVLFLAARRGIDFAPEAVERRPLATVSIIVLPIAHPVHPRAAQRSSAAIAVFLPSVLSPFCPFPPLSPLLPSVLPSPILPPRFPSSLPLL